MALRNGSSATLVLPELIELLKGYERQNNCELTFDGRLTDRGGRIDLVWTVSAWDGDPAVVGVRRLGLASAGCLEKRLVTMEAVLIHLLYALDFVLAESAYNEVKNKEQ